MNTKFVAALAVCAAFSVTSALAQQKAPEKEPDLPKLTMPEAEKLVAAIKADKAKTKDFCALNALNEQFEAAAKKNDQKKLDTLAQQQEELAKKIGLPEAEPDEQAMALFETLAKTCGK
jgi:hypothetical protein